MSQHPELVEEQAYIDARVRVPRAGPVSRRFACAGMVEVGRGGTEQARYERDVIEETVRQPAGPPRARRRRAGLRPHRPSRHRGRGVLHRPSRPWPTNARSRSSSTGGRRSPSRSTGRPAATPWAWPGAGTSPSTAGTLLGIEDELFGERRTLGADATATPPTASSGHGALHRRARESRAPASSATSSPPSRASRTRSSGPPLPGVLVVQGGPGTGKTVVALHRAAYLLYTHRFPLEGQGVLVVGPNRLFLALHRAGAAVARRGRRRAGRARRPRRRR